MNFTIEKEIFKFFPGMKIVAVEAKGIVKADGEKIKSMLDKGWKTASAAAVRHTNAQSHPFIKPWGDRMKGVGAPRKHFPSSVEAMVRRAGKGGEPFSINPVVDFYNAISLEYIVTAGAFDMDEMNGDLELRFSKEGDTFTSLDSSENVAVPAGEVSYADGNIIITRHFVYKQAKHALINENSKNIFFVSEILGELPEGTAETVADAFVKGIKECFGVQATAVILDENRTSLY